jgi:peptidoglycan/LPS O-acetylase OafA/YrhL
MPASLGPYKLQGIEVARAVAALLVIYNHLFTFQLVPKSALVIWPAQYATEAVMLFFVLSGAVIRLSTERLQRRASKVFELARLYVGARLLRILPIFLVGLALAVAAERLIDGEWPRIAEVAGNALFLQSLPGYVVSVPRYNMPLWSLACEMAYYLAFAVCLVWPWLMGPWLALGGAAAFFWWLLGGYGALSHVAFLLAFSGPWLFGSLVAKHRNSLPRVSISFGIAVLLIGLGFARCPLSDNYYDTFRLTAFAACCCPLVLSLVQDELTANGNGGLGWPFVARLLCGAGALVLLWTVSPSLVGVKATLTLMILVGACAPLWLFAQILSWLKFGLPLLVYIGSISYALYAIHAPMIAIVNHFVSASPMIKVAFVLIVIPIIAHCLEHLLQPAIVQALGSVRGRVDSNDYELVSLQQTRAT